MRAPARFSPAACPWSLLLLSTALAVALASCGGDGGGPGPEPGPGPPEPPALAFDPAVGIDSPQPVARQSREELLQELRAANRPLETIDAFLGAFQKIPWGDPSGPCWRLVVSLDDCDLTTQVCRTGASLVWSTILDGSCEGENYQDWTLAEAVTDSAANSGTLRAYEPGSTRVEGAIDWKSTELDGAGEAMEWDGDSRTGNLLQRVLWSFAPGESLRVVRRSASDIGDSLRTEIVKAAGSRQGRASWLARSLTEEGYRPRLEIRWLADGSGRRTEYNRQGEVLSVASW